MLLTWTRRELSFEGTDSSVREVVVTTEGDGLEWTLEIDEEAREWLYAEKGGRTVLGDGFGQYGGHRSVRG